jgi:hypothetical protein
MIDGREDYWSLPHYLPSQTLLWFIELLVGGTVICDLSD